MKQVLAFALLAACAVEPDDEGVIEQAALCMNKFYCGPNTLKLGILSFFELDMTGKTPAPTTGVKIESFEDGAGVKMAVDVQGFHLRGIKPGGIVVQGGGPPPFGLLNAKLTIVRGTKKFVVTINSVSNTQHFYQGGNVPATFTFPSYGMTVVEVGVASKPKNVCSVPHNNTLMFQTAPYEVLISRGDRYDPSTGEVYATGAATTTWFNLACTGDAISKAQVLRYGEPKSTGPFTTDGDDRTTIVRAIRADYCGTGTGYTESGTPISIGNAANWLWLAPLPNAANLEAIWGPDGAICLANQRIPTEIVACDIDACTDDQIENPFTYGDIVTVNP
jgi:hypothetical protein